MAYYSVFSFFTSFVLCTFIWFKQDIIKYNSVYNDINDPKIWVANDNTQTSNLILAMSLSAYIIVALYSMIFSFRRLNRPGVGPGVRKLFQRKHSAYVILFIIVWTIQLSASYCHLFNPERFDNPSEEDIGS
jgi:hypothetical protein